MATRTQQKQELFSAIWDIAENLRNSVDVRDSKCYVNNMQRAAFNTTLYA